MKRTFKERIISVGLVLGSIILLNILIRSFILRIDLTEDKIYTLSSSTKKVLSRLDDILTVKAYFSEKLPPQLIPVKTQVADILKDYRTYSRGRIHWAFVDPTKDPKLEAQVQRMGIPKVQMNILEKDKLQVVGGFLGLGIFYKDKTEVIPLIQSTEELEYELTSRVLKLTRGAEVTVGILNLSDNPDNFSFLEEELGKQYSIRSVNEKFFPGNLDLLVCVGWKQNISNKLLYKIDQFIMEGGRAIFLVDAVKVGDDLRAQKLKPDDLKFFNKFGIKISPELVKDGLSHESAPFASGFMSFIIPYPYWVKVKKKNFAEENPMVGKLESLVLPWPSPVDTSTDTTLPSLSYTVLSRTTKRAWREKSVFNLMPPMGRTEKIPEKTEVIPLAVLVDGKFKSFFERTEIPAQEDTTEFKEQSPETQVVVVGNVKFLDDRFLQMYPENRVFILNLVDGMGFGKELIAIRSKGKTDRPVKELSDFRKSIFKGFNTFGIAIIVVIFGIARFVLRQRRKYREEGK